MASSAMICQNMDSHLLHRTPGVYQRDDASRTKPLQISDRYE